MKRVWKTGRLGALAQSSALVFVFLALAPPVPAQVGGESGVRTVPALFLSDIHFEPFLDPGKAVKLAAAPVSQWNRILAAPASADAGARWAKVEQTCPTRGADTSFALYRSSLRAIHIQAGDARFAIVGGDLIAHSFSCKFTAVFPQAAPGDYRAFVEKTIDYVLAELRAALPGVPVYAALGNNDSDCGDYQLDANGAFLKESGEIFAADLRGAERAQALDTFASGGFYAVSLPAPVENARLLVLDDLFMSEKYQTCGGKVDRAPAAAQIMWLKQQLDDARAKKEKVWVMAHIPPGVDSYSTAKKWMALCAGGKPKMFLASETLPETLASYGDVIELAIFAHTHMDEVRLLAPAKTEPAQKPVAVKIVASITPINGNNPSFTVAAVDPRTATLTDYRVIAASNQTGIDTKWTEEYDFRQTYHEPAFTAATVESLIAGFKRDPAAQTPASQSYLRSYMTGVDMRMLSLIWQPYVCSLKNDTSDVYRECVCKNAP
jgi:sphingomyelin phosphodiesterase acid-like 3